jgi:hypothetical protein
MLWGCLGADPGGADQDVELRVIDGGDHDASWLIADADGFEWMQERLARKQPATTCPSS